MRVVGKEGALEGGGGDGAGDELEQRHKCIL